MKKTILLLLISLLFVSLSGCALFELIEGNKNVVVLGNGEEFVKWNLVSNNNDYQNVDSAYFEFNDDVFKYYENGSLKREGKHRITFFGLENTISPLHINLIFDDKESEFDYIDCYTEDSKDNIQQFTIISEGYRVETERPGGVPIRDYHLSDMPYAFGTYVKESANEYTYKNGKANYLNCSKLDGKFVDELGNVMYFANNAYSSDPKSVSYDIYMRYENNVNNTFIEGTIILAYTSDEIQDEANVALIYVSHGSNEPGEESGTSIEADYEFINLKITDEAITFSLCKRFSEKVECDYDPVNFIGGTYTKIK